MTTRSVLVVAAGDVDSGRLRAAAEEASLVVAADGGAATCIAAGVRPDHVIGDGDSLAPSVCADLERRGVSFTDAEPTKDESDTELALLTALDLGATEITLLGAFGRQRPEHALANTLLLADPRFDDVRIRLETAGSTLSRIGTADGPGRATVKGNAGDLVSLLPLAGAVDGVRTDGLRFPLVDEALRPGPARGLSNELIGNEAVISTARGPLLIVHTPARIETDERSAR